MNICIRLILSILLFVCYVPDCLAQGGDTLSGPNRSAGLFADSQELSSSDYLSSIEQANETMNMVGNKSTFSRRVNFIFDEIKETHSTISLLNQNIRVGSGTNIRNQRMYQKLLIELDKDLESYKAVLKTESETIKDLRKDLRGIMRDTVFRRVLRDSTLRSQFQEQLSGMRDKWLDTDSQLKSNLATLNAFSAEISLKKMAVAESMEMVNARLDRSGVSMFSNECPNLWDSYSDLATTTLGAYISQKFAVELKAFTYYFGYSIGNTVFVVIFMLLLYWWVRSNIDYLCRTGNYETLNDFNFRALNKGAALPIVIVALNLAIAINLYAPALYIEFLHLLLLLALTFAFYGKFSKKAFSRWLLLVTIFAAFSFTDLFLKVSFLQRCIFIGINVVAIRYGLVNLRSLREEMYIKRFFSWGNAIFISLNVLAILFNLFGRVSLAHTLSLSAIIALTQMVALSVLLKIVIEIIILQIYTTRLKRGIDKIFDHEKLAKNAQRPFIFVMIYLWIIVMASNLNISETVTDVAGFIFNRKNHIGSFEFTLGSILLFFFIAWIAHLLQNFVAFFFGEIEDDSIENINKRQYSKLLIIRLIILICGYLLAISASGMPIDKLTIILGALGVGVGLGLQSVVNNFVSGVILIFERPIQIGDVIESGGKSGRVKEIGLRTTKIDTSNGAEVIIPNGSILSQNITNWTYTNNFKLVDVDITVKGEMSQEEVSDTIVATLNTVQEISSELDKQIFYHSITQNKYKITVKFWCNIYRTDQVLSAARIALFESFSRKGMDVVE
jgi:potassium efflux system protein